MVVINKHGKSHNFFYKWHYLLFLRQWLCRSITFLMLCVTVFVIIYLNQDEALPISHVIVEGNFIYSNKDELVTAIGSQVTCGFMSVNIFDICQVIEAFSWIKKVQVIRVWPDTLYIIVDEHTAIAQWKGQALVNEYGEIFQSSRRILPTNLVILHGLEGSSKVMAKQLLVIQQHVSELGLTIKQVTMDHRRAWTIYFNGSIEVILGRADNNQRLQSFVKVFKAILYNYREYIAAVDMRYTSGMSVIWKYDQKPDLNGTL